MGYRNHLHVCQHCGVVHATASATGPRKCVVCDAATFSPSELNGLLRERGDPDARSSDPADGGAERVTPSVVRP